LKLKPITQAAGSHSEVHIDHFWFFDKYGYRVNTAATDLRHSIFSTCRRTLGSSTSARVLAAMDEDDPPESFPGIPAALTADLKLAAYLADLARLEWTLFQNQGQPHGIGQPVDMATANPSLTLLPVGWKHLPDLIEPAASQITPLCEPAHTMIWQHPRPAEWRCRDAEDIDLLALKLIVEQIDARQAATQGKVSVSAILGNPGPREPIEQLLNIAHPHYFQISLEGLDVFNDKDPFCFAARKQ
jgi:hypothetical protein